MASAHELTGPNVERRGGAGRLMNMRVHALTGSSYHRRTAARHRGIPVPRTVHFRSQMADMTNEDIRTTPQARLEKQSHRARGDHVFQPDAIYIGGMLAIQFGTKKMPADAMAIDAIGAVLRSS